MKLKLSPLGHTWILDLDGTLVVHNGYKLYGKDIFLKGAKEFLQSISEKDMIIFLTSRSKDYAKITEEFLEENGIEYHHIIYDVPYGERVLINDNKDSGLNMAYAVCVDRNGELNSNLYEIDSNL